MIYATPYFIVLDAAYNVTYGVHIGTYRNAQAAQRAALEEAQAIRPGAIHYETGDPVAATYDMVLTAAQALRIV